MAAVMEPEREDRPWYRQFWPWFLIAIPAASVVAGLLTVWIAATTADGLVVDDYYRAGLAINKVLARERRAAELGVRADLLFAAGRLRVVLQGAAPAKLRVRLLHPTRAGHDRTLLIEGHGGVYEAPLPPLPPASWHVHVEPADGAWVLKGRVRLPAPEAVLVIGGAEPPAVR